MTKLNQHIEKYLTAYEVQLGNLSPDEFLSRNPADEIVKIMAEDEEGEVVESNLEKILKRHDLQWSTLYTSFNTTVFTPEIWKLVFSNEPIEQFDISSERLRYIGNF